MKKLLITDLDDTLYDWIGFFIPAFYAMVDELYNITNIDRKVLLGEYKKLHQKYGSVEYPFVTLELPSIKEKYKEFPAEKIKEILGEAFHRFNSVRKQKLRLYDGVADTLDFLFKQGVIIIGYTESAQENGLYRLKKLEIDQYFKHIYASQSQYKNNHIIDEKAKTVYTKKPDKDILLEICRTENCPVDDVVYVGDSLTKDIYMAQQAGITSVWANYPKEKNDYYKLLVDITSWTSDDFERESELKEQFLSKGVQPDYTIDDFSQLMPIVLK
jgi:HAD superfamily hydrolase (TIGR01549 family)